MNKNKGITLIALVVTIIVLIILAGISINLLLGDNGILKKAKDSASEQEIGQRKEAVSMAVTAEYANKNGEKSLMTVEGVLKELQVTQGSTSIYAKKGETEIRSTDGSTPLEGGDSFHFPAEINPASKKEIVVTLDENLNVEGTTTQTGNNSNNNNQSGEQTGNQTIDDTLYGFFDDEGNQLASWSTLTGAPYYLDVNKDYDGNTYIRDNGESGNSAYYVINNSNTLSGGAFTTDDIVEVRIPGNTSTTTGNIKENTKLASTVISDSIVNKIAETEITPVTQIGNYAFYECKKIKKVTIPNVTKIGKYAFRECEKIESIIIPDTTTIIGEMAFYECSEMSNLNLGNGVREIGDHAFSECKKITSLTIPNTVITINGYAFYGTKLNEIRIPNSVINIKEYAFYNSNLDLEEVYIEEGSTELKFGVNVFAIDNLEKITVGRNITGNSSYDRRGNVVAKTEVTLLSNVNKIGNNAFENLVTLKSIEILGNITSIGNAAFSHCYGLKNIEIPNTVTSIGNYAFFECGNLTTITLQSGLTNIGERAFEECTRLTTVNIPESVTNIGERAFYDCNSLTSINISKNVNSIGDMAFLGCYSVTSATVDQNNTKYDSRNNCNAIIETATNKLIFGFVNTTIPNTVEIIEAYAFFSNNNITNITLPENLKVIGEEAFYDTGLISIDIPNRVTTIGKMAFASCDNLTSVTIPESLVNIGEGAFEDCTNLSDVTNNSNLNFESYEYNDNDPFSNTSYRNDYPIEQVETSTSTSTSTASNQ